MSEGKIERGAAEDASGVPITETDSGASKRPPSQPREDTDQVDDGSGVWAARPAAPSAAREVPATRPVPEG
jgi:hypothetical protein